MDNQEGTATYDSAVTAALVENKPIMIVHAFNGGYLRPVELNADSHDKAVQLATTLDPATKDSQGHLWYITPAGFFGQRPLYVVESAAGETPSEGTDASKPQRRRLTIHPTAPKIDTVRVGRVDKMDAQWRGTNGSPEDNQLWIVTVTQGGGLTFVPVTHPDTILGIKDQTITTNSEVRLVPNWGGDFSGTVVNTFYPRLPTEWYVL
jgi:hypothetical protein